MPSEKLDEKLFSPTNVGELQISSHIVLCPLTRLRATPDNIPSQLMLEYYDERSKNPGTFLITEASSISNRFGSISNQAGCWNDRQINNWGKIVERVHLNKSYIFLQLGGHCKVQPLCNMRVRHWRDGKTKLGELEEDFESLVEYEEAYVRCAKAAIEVLKFDGIEISPYHYIDECISFGVYNRDRIQIITRFVKFLKEKVIPSIGGKEGKLGLKIGVINKKEKMHLVENLNMLSLKVGYLTITEPRLTNNKISSDASTESNDWIFNKWSGTVIRVGGYLDNIPKLNIDIQHNDRTLIGVGKYFSSNPDLIDKLKANTSLVPYNRATFYTNTSVGYRGWLDDNYLETDHDHINPIAICSL